MRRLKNLIVLLLVLVTVTALLPVSAAAAGKIDLNAKCHLTVHFFYDRYDLPDATFRAYKVADVTEDAEYTVNERFEGCAAAIEDLFNRTGVGEYSAELAVKNYIFTHSNIYYNPDVTPKSTGRDGRVTFDEGLEPGLYIVIGTGTRYNEVNYFPIPTFVFLPGLDERNQWVYNVEMEPKKYKDQPVDITVFKNWDDDDNYYRKRPSSISVKLIGIDEDGDIYETKTAILNPTNGWEYEWTNLPCQTVDGLALEWMITESRVDYYGTPRISVNDDGTYVVITNPYVGYTPTPSPTATPPQKLPQTGQLWWPVPVLAVIGMVLVLLGFRVKRREDE